MITRATPEQTDEIHEVWKTCFPKEDPKYLDFYFKTLFRPENCYVKTLEGKIVSVALRNRHVMMFNGRALAVSMISGVATLPEYRNRGCMHEVMHVVLDACEHTELFTLIQTEHPELYESMGFSTIYYRTKYQITRKDLARITTFGCAYDTAPIDMLKVYSAYIKRFNGFYARDLDYFVNYKKEVAALGGKIISFYNGKHEIRGYVVLIPQGKEMLADELVYLDSVSLAKLCSAALQERKIVNLQVSRAEDLAVVFPDSKYEDYGSTMVKLNDARLFSKVFNRKVKTVEEAYGLSSKPLNLNESD